MKIEVMCKNLNKQNPVILKISQMLLPKGNMSVDLKKNKLTINNLSNSKMTECINVLNENLEYDAITFDTQENKFKIKNSEKELRAKKEQMKKDILENSTSTHSIVKKFVFEEKVFTLDQMREAFPDFNYGTIRNYINKLKKDGIIVELDRGKYALM